MRLFLPAQHCQQSRNVVGQGSQALGDRPEAVQAQGVHGQAAKRGHDLGVPRF